MNTVIDAFKVTYFYENKFLADSEYPLTDVVMVRWVSILNSLVIGQSETKIPKQKRLVTNEFETETHHTIPMRVRGYSELARQFLLQK